MDDMRKYIEQSQREQKKAKAKHKKSLRDGAELTRLANERIANGLAETFTQAMSQLEIWSQSCGNLTPWATSHQRLKGEFFMLKDLEVPGWIQDDLANVPQDIKVQQIGKFILNNSLLFEKLLALEETVAELSELVMQNKTVSRKLKSWLLGKNV